MGGSKGFLLSLVLVESGEGRGEDFVYFPFMFKVGSEGLVIFCFCFI